MHNQETHVKTGHKEASPVKGFDINEPTEGGSYGDDDRTINDLIKQVTKDGEDLNINEAAEKESIEVGDKEETNSIVSEEEEKVVEEEKVAEKDQGKDEEKDE